MANSDSDIPNAEPDRIREQFCVDWGEKLNIPAKDLENIKTCLDILQLPVGASKMLNKELSEWLDEKDDGWLDTFSGNGNIAKQKQAIQDCTFQTILKRWGKAFNIPPHSQKYSHILYKISNNKINFRKKLLSSKKRKEEQLTETPMAARAESCSLPSHTRLNSKSPHPLSTLAMPPSRYPALPHGQFEWALEVIFREEGEDDSICLLSHLQPEEVAETEAAIRTIDEAKVEEHLRSIYGDGLSTIALRIQCPQDQRLHNTTVSNRNTLKTLIGRAYRAQQRTGPIVFLVEDPWHVQVDDPVPSVVNDSSGTERLQESSRLANDPDDRTPHTTLYPATPGSQKKRRHITDSPESEKRSSPNALNRPTHPQSSWLR
jgi:hypothetical protein